MSDPWDGLLGPDEEIIWQGAPQSRLRLEWNTPLLPFFYLFFTGFSVFWMSGVRTAGGYFWMFGLLFFFVGLYGLVGVHFWKAFTRRHQHYTLTNKRAFIGTSMFGRRTLDAYPIDKSTDVELQDAGQTGDVYFARKVTQGRRGLVVTRIGFEQIEGARRVLQLIGEVQDQRG